MTHLDQKLCVPHVVVRLRLLRDVLLDVVFLVCRDVRRRWWYPLRERAATLRCRIITRPASGSWALVDFSAHRVGGVRPSAAIGRVVGLLALTGVGATSIMWTIGIVGAVKVTCAVGAPSVIGSVRAVGVAAATEVSPIAGVGAVIRDTTVVRVAFVVGIHRVVGPFRCFVVVFIQPAIVESSQGWRFCVVGTVPRPIPIWPAKTKSEKDHVRDETNTPRSA